MDPQKIEYLCGYVQLWVEKVRNLTPTKIIVHGVTDTAQKSLGYNMLQMHACGSLRGVHTMNVIDATPSYHL